MGIIKNGYEMKDTILVMFSGGVDSTFMLYHYLKNTDYNIHVHHISLRYPSEPRWEEEDMASRKVVEYCKNIRDFEYTESRFDIDFYKYVGRDSDTQLLVASKVAPNLKGNVRVALGWQYRDIRSDVFTGRMDNKVSEKLWSALCNSMDAPFGENVSRKLLFPLIYLKMTKKNIIQEMQGELLKLTWSCRKPIVDENSCSYPCGHCRVCKQIKETLK